jgi:hypothetical protein
MVQTSKAGLALAVLAVAFTLPPTVGAQEPMKQDKLQEDKMMHDGKAKTLEKSSKSFASMPRNIQAR